MRPLAMWTITFGFSLAAFLCFPPAAWAGPYEDAVLADGPEGFWRLDEASGPTAANSGTVGAALNATYNNAGGFTFNQPGLFPGTDASVRLDGSTSSGGTEVRIPDNAAINTGTFANKTIEAIFQANSIGTSPTVIYEQGGGTRGLNIHVQQVGGVDTLFLSAWNQAESNWGNPPVTVSTPINIGEPYHIAMVLIGNPDGNDNTNDGTLLGYLNGALFDAAAGAGVLRSHSDDVTIGGIHDSATAGTRFWDNTVAGSAVGNFDGFIDSVASFNTALTADQILTHFQAAAFPSVVPEPGSLVVWSLIGLVGLGCAWTRVTARGRRRSAPVA